VIDSDVDRLSDGGLKTLLPLEGCAHFENGEYGDKARAL